MQMGAREIAIALRDGFAKSRHRLFQLAAFVIGAAEVVIGFGEMIVLRQRCLEGFDGQIVLLLGGIDAA